MEDAAYVVTGFCGDGQWGDRVAELGAFSSLSKAQAAADAAVAAKDKNLYWTAEGGQVHTIWDRLVVSRLAVDVWAPSGRIQVCEMQIYGVDAPVWTAPHDDAS